MSPDRDQQRPDRRPYRLAGWRDRARPAPDALGHVDDLIPGYVLGALEEAESAAVETHLRSCPTCEGLVADAQRTASMLPFLAPYHAPPADTKISLFARVAHARKAAIASVLPGHSLDALRTQTFPSSAADQPTYWAAEDPAASQTRSRESRAAWLVSVVSLPLLIALVATGFWGLQLQNRLTSQDAQLADLQSELTNFGSGTTSYQLSPGGANPGAEGEIVMAKDQRAGMLQIDVNADDGARSFEMWAMRDGQLVRISDVTVNQDGLGQARFELDQPFSEYESVHIRAKPIDAASEIQDDTLMRDSEGALGSTGSGLDIGP